MKVLSRIFIDELEGGRNRTISMSMWCGGVEDTAVPWRVHCNYGNINMIDCGWIDSLILLANVGSTS